MLSMPLLAEAILPASGDVLVREATDPLIEPAVLWPLRTTTIPALLALLLPPRGDRFALLGGDR